jgi:hypothetical protein
MAYRVHQYDSSGYCNSPTTVSRNCITKSTQTVYEVTKKTIGGGTGPGASPEEYLYGIVILSSNKSTIWLKPFPKQLKAGSKVETLSWNGHYIGISDNGKIQHAYYWEPAFAKISAYLWLVSIIMFHCLPFLFRQLYKTRFKKLSVKLHIKAFDHPFINLYVAIVSGFFLGIAFIDGLLRMGMWP